MDPTGRLAPYVFMKLPAALDKLAYALIIFLTTWSPAHAESSAARDSTPTHAERMARQELVVALFQWIDATNARNFSAQSRFYPDTMDAFYRWRNVPRADVLEEKRRVFARATVIDIGADAPQLIIEPGAQSARMYFRKRYVIDGTTLNRTGEVLQELRWARHPDGWKITSERDLRVLRQARR